MNFEQEIAWIQAQTLKNTPAVSISGIDWNFQMVNIDATTAGDLLGAAVNHQYFIRELRIYETGSVSGSPIIQGYDFVPAAISLVNLGLTLARPVHLTDFWCTRLAYTAGAGGTYGVVLRALDITYA